MVTHTKGIVIHFIRFKETSIIVKVFTFSHGLLSFIVNGVRKAKAKTSMGIYQPMTMVEMVFNYREQGKILRIQEIHPAYAYTHLPFDLRKLGVGAFCTEVLQKTLVDHVVDEAKFDFLWEYFQLLDKESEHIENFHLYFLARLSKHMGFYPHDVATLFSTHHPYSEEMKAILDAIFNNEPIQLKGVQRREALLLLLDYYKQHIEHFGDMKSLEVLREVFSS